MKKSLLMFAVLLTAGAAQASPVSSDVAQCGANPNSSDLMGPYDSDPTGNGGQISIDVNGRDLRAIVVRSSKKTTRINDADIYDRNSGSRDLSRGTIVLEEDQEQMFCVPRRMDVTQFRISTSGSSKGKYRVYFFYGR